MKKKLRSKTAAKPKAAGGLKEYLILVFVLSWIVAGAIYLTGQSLFLYAFMFTPIISAVIVKKRTGESLKDGLGCGIKKYFIAAWFIPVIIVFGTIIFSVFFGFGILDLSTVSPEFAEFFTEAGITPETFFYMGIAINLTFALLLGIIVTLGEEYGWRNFMIQRLMRFGRTKALIYSGIIWGLWHAPIIAIGFNYGTNYPFFPITGIIMMCIFTILLGVILTWLRYASKSVWPSALGHAVYNNAAGAFALYYTTSLFMGSVAGLMAFIIMGIIILILQMTGELKKIK